MKDNIIREVVAFSKEEKIDILKSRAAYHKTIFIAMVFALISIVCFELYFLFFIFDQTNRAMVICLPFFEMISGAPPLIIAAESMIEYTECKHMIKTLQNNEID